MANQWPRPPLLESLVTNTPYERGELIYARGDPVEHWYRVVSGVAREFALLPDGRRLIMDLLVPGDDFGFGSEERQAVAVEAVEGAVVARYPRRRVEMLAHTDPDVRRYVRERVFKASARLQARILILGRATPLEKVGAFLLEISERSFEGRVDPGVLRMAREDIADYLELPVETVSRALAELRANGAITLAANHRITIVSRDAPEEDAGRTPRGAGDHAGRCDGDAGSARRGP